MKKYKGPYVLSCKLDGESGLYSTEGNEPRLYTRGDGKVGQDISFLLPYLKLPTKKGIVVRGEFIIPKKVFQEKYAEQFAALFQIAHVYTWSLFQSSVGIPDLPLSRAFFSSVAIDDRIRKSPLEKTVTLSNPDGATEVSGVEYSMSELAEIGAIDKLTTRFNAIQKGLI
jgi:hypothetical protein